jgi:hypothetical protein
MTEFLLLVIALGTLAIAVLVFRISMNLRSLRLEHIPEVLAALRMLSKLPARSNGPHIHHTYPPCPEDLLNYLIWEWRDGSWHVVDEGKVAGLDAGMPPAYPGTFTGERVKTWTPRRIW